MQTVSSDRSTCFSVVSAVECTATVLMPSSRQARKIRSAISPRLAMRTYSSIVLCARSRIILRRLFFDHEERLTEFDRVAVLDEDADDAAGEFRFDLMHHLHRLDDAQRDAGLHLGADLDEWLRAGRGAAIERADHG